MTRALFSKRVAMSAAHIKALETGKYKISAEDAAQVATVTKVDPRCLTDPSLPLTDLFGNPMEGQPLGEYFDDEFLDAKALFDTAFEVAEEKRKQTVFLFLFQRWLEKTCEILGLEPAITDKLQERYPLQCFGAIPEYFWPEDQKKREKMYKRVRKFEKEFRAEIVKLLLPPAETTKTHFEKATTDPEALLERQFDEIFVRGGLGFTEAAWDLRKKMIEEAKASLQKQPKHSRTR